MDLVQVMTEVAEAAGTITGLRACAFPPDNVQPPAAFPLLPDSITFDGTYQRGKDRITLPLLVVVARAVDRTGVARLAGYAAGSGTGSIKHAVESHTYTALGSVRVTGADFDVVTIAGQDHLAATFNLDIVGTGA